MSKSANHVVWPVTDYTAVLVSTYYRVKFKSFAFAMGLPELTGSVNQCCLTRVSVEHGWNDCGSKWTPCASCFRHQWTNRINLFRDNIHWLHCLTVSVPHFCLRDHHYYRLLPDYRPTKQQNVNPKCNKSNNTYYSVKKLQSIIK